MALKLVVILFCSFYSSLMSEIWNIGMLDGHLHKFGNLACRNLQPKYIFAQNDAYSSNPWCGMQKVWNLECQIFSDIYVGWTYYVGWTKFLIYIRWGYYFWATVSYYFELPWFNFKSFIIKLDIEPILLFFNIYIIWFI